MGYGAAEGGRDYNTTWIPEIQLREVFLRSFHAAREKALLRTEGKEYVVKDGDVINFMHTG